MKATLKDIINKINNHTFLKDEPEKGDPVTPCMDVYKAKIQYYGSLDKSKSRIVVRGEFHNREMIGYIWAPT